MYVRGEPGTWNMELQPLAGGGAVRIMDEKISDTQYMVTPGQDKVIRVGKKFFRILEG